MTKSSLHLSQSDPQAWSKLSDLHFFDPATGEIPEESKSLTQQNFLEETDINNIVARFKNTGELPLTQKVARYGDFSDIPDYQTAQSIVQTSNKLFMDLPSDIRSYFNNNPQEFIEFMQDDKNLDKAVALGLVKIDHLEEPSEPSKELVRGSEATTPASPPKPSKNASNAD